MLVMWAAVAGAGVVVLSGVSAAYTWSLATSGCDELRRSDLSLHDMVMIKRQIDKAEKEPTTAIQLNGEEATFLLADNLRLPVYIDAADDELLAHVVLEQKERCIDIRFQGRVEVDQGVASVMPSRLKLGSLDLSSVLGDRMWTLPDWLVGDHEVAAVLDNTDRLRVEGDTIEVQMEDVTSLR